jgi:branched-chain amino acid transport system ATP-binding protein
MVGWAPHRNAPAGIGFVPEDRHIFAALSGQENLGVALRLARRPGRWTIERVYELFPALSERRDQQGGPRSGGEQQMLTAAVAPPGNLGCEGECPMLTCGDRG